MITGVSPKWLLPVKIREESTVPELWLRVDMCESENLGEVTHLFILFLGYRAAEHPSLSATRGWAELTHDGQWQIRSEFLMHGRQHGEAVVNSSWQNEVSDQDSGVRGDLAAWIPRLEWAFVFVHRLDGRQRQFRIAAVAHALLSQCGVRELEIGEEDIDGFLSQERDHFRSSVAGAVEEHRDADTVTTQSAAELNDMRQEVVGRHQVQIVHSLPQQGLGIACEFGRGQCPATVGQRDLVVLTEEAPAGTA